MRGKLEKEGNYELFQTTKGSQILNLNNNSFFAVVKGRLGDILVATDEDHKKGKTLKKGHFYLADFDDDPEFRDLPHLFLQEGRRYREWILPNGQPTQRDYQKKLIRTGNLVTKSKVDYHVKGAGAKGSEKQYSKEHEGLKNRTKSQLLQEARKRNISGRSTMTKQQLVNQLTWTTI